MIKTRVGSIDEFIAEAIKENGGTPPDLFEGVPFTRENWDKMQAEAKKRLPEYIRMERLLQLFEDSDRKYNC